MTLILTSKKKSSKCQEIPIISGETLPSPFLDLDRKKRGGGGESESQARLIAIDYLDRKRCSRSFPSHQVAYFVLPVTLRSATFAY